MVNDSEIIAYDPNEIEKKWQKRWTEAKIFESDRNKKKKYFINFPFPYINGAPHLGHGYSLLKAEAMARFQRMLGKNVLFPFAFHATGEPIVGAAKRVKQGDEKQILTLKLSSVPVSEIPKFKDPKYIVNYFRKRWTETVQSIGLAIDWRRQFVTTTLTPVFSKFIEWQYRKLKREGYVVQGSHPVIWCPADRNPTGDHDRLEGEGARVVDFILLKFLSKKHNAYLLPATLRPETTYGVTNMFLHPKADYIKVEIDGEFMIISKPTLIKFEDQQHKIGKIEDIPIKELIGSTCINPVTGNKIPILPGEFIDFEGSTGVVMSVPAHAPMDWIALKNLKENATELKKWNISQKVINSVKPISLIQVDGYGEFPAGEAIDELGITDMNDPNVKEATKIIYRKEYNSGILKAITGEYEGKSVQNVKEELITDFINKKIAFILKEPGEVVICRCGTRNHVKYLENQWFLEFSDPKWKKKTHGLIDSMDIYPEEARLAFHNTVDWLENKACARRSGLGTPLPWDKDWIVETLSDSVIYMIYYIISKYVNSGEFKEEYANDRVFDYLILGKGDPEQLETKYKIPIKLSKMIRQDVDYYYGFDMRTSGKDLLNNHLTFMLMHHTALFPKKYWPKAIAVNGYVAIVKPGALKGEKMSKSKGNFKTIEDVTSTFGVDVTRLIFLIAGEGFKDAQMTIEDGESYSKWLQSLYLMAFEDVDDNEVKEIDRWLFSRIQNKITLVRDHLSKMETRSAFQIAYHELMQDLRWYVRRRGSKGPAYKDAIEKSILMITPYVPHFSEEIWEKSGKKGFASNAKFPAANKKLIDTKAELTEKVLSSFMDDLKGLKKFLGERNNPDPKLIEIFVSPQWKYDVYNYAFNNGLEDLIKKIMQNPEMRKMGKEAPKYAQELMKAGGPPDFQWDYEDEYSMLTDSKEYIEREIECQVQIIEATDSTHPKAKISIPRRPGINFITE